MKKQAETVQRPERLWTVTETSAFLNIPVGTLGLDPVSWTPGYAA